MKYTVIDSCNKDFRKEFKSKKECQRWVLSGMNSCEGAERDHYVNMFSELIFGNTTLHYN